MHIQVSWERVGNTTNADRFVNSFDVVNITNGTVDNTWTSTDFTTVANHIIVMVNYAHALQPTTVRCIDIKFYRRFFNPYSISEPFAPSGPPVWTVAVGTAGTLTATGMINQAAITHTEKTTYPRHWGRSYWPVPAASMVNADGHFASTPVDTFGLGLQTVYNQMQTEEFFPVVPVTQVQGAPTRGLLTITQVQVDDIPDVIRRRRLRNKTHAFVGP